VVEFRDNRIIRATVNGTPAQFEQKRDGAENPARGRARQIVYEVEAGTVRFANDAWLSNGANEISGPLLVYNIRQEKVQATTAPDGSQRVQITIKPGQGGKPAVVKPQPAPGPDEPQP
jgi:lipopolysaccharide export system protein LptA